MRVLVNGVHLYFDVDGPRLVPDGSTMRSRPSLLLVHGGPGYDHSGFKPDFSRLADVAQVVYLDLRGNGRSDRASPATWNLSQWAADLHGFCAALEIERPIVLGASFGGEVAMRFAVDYPEQPAGVILISATARLRLDRSLAAFERLGGVAARDAAARYWHAATPETHAEYLRVCVPLYSARAEHAAAVRRRALMYEDVAVHYNSGEARSVNLLPELRHIRCNTLLIAGTDDPITTIEDAEDIAQALPDGRSRLFRLEGCRHLPYRDDPDRVFGAIEAFVREVSV
jgi:pimeloyl-ACP methyl ester carboxylesterase